VERKIYAYSRPVNVKWSPDSSRIAITDVGGSDFVNCLVLTVSDGSTVDVNADLRRQPGLSRYFDRNDHVYCEIVRWTSVDILMVYPVRIVGSSRHQELWLPEDLNEFNRHVEGTIEVSSRTSCAISRVSRAVPSRPEALANH
jgi:hypothetical protein